MNSPHWVHFMLKGAMRRTVCTLGPGFLGPRVRVIFEGSKSGGSEWQLVEGEVEADTPNTYSTFGGPFFQTW